jgi:HK97 family phage prohead protease
MPPRANLALLDEVRDTVSKRRAGMQFKQNPASLQMDDDAFTAYFAIFSNVDRANEVIEPGAFTNLDEWLRTGWVGVNHGMQANPVAYPTSATQDRIGLLVSGKFHGTAEGQAIRQVLRERLDAGLDCACSVGYRTLESEPSYVNGKNVKILKRLWLAECSFVNLPANPAAKVISVKAAPRLAALPYPPLDILAMLVRETKGGICLLKKKNRSLVRALKDVIDQYPADDDDEDTVALRQFLRQYTRDEEDGLLLTAHEDHSNTAVDDEASQRAMANRPPNTYRRSEEVIDQGGKAPQAPHDPRRAAGNALPQIGSPTGPLMEGRSKFSNPFSDRQRALDERRLKDILNARAEKVWGKSATSDFEELPRQVQEMEIASLILAQKAAFQAGLGHQVTTRPRGW